MLTLDTLRTRGRRFIARNRRHVSVHALHRLATFIEDSYENDEWDMCANGETTLMRRLAPGRFAVAFDVGAHAGDWTAEALRAWPGSYVHAFELAPPTFGRLQRHIHEEGFATRSTLNCVGLGDTSGPREMHYFPEHPHLTCDMPRHNLPSTPFLANMIEGDRYVSERGIDTIDFLKIDVEGAEHRVLAGFRNSLEAGRINCIQFEYGAFSIQTKVLLADYYERLASLYWIGKIFPSHVEFRDYDWTMETFRFSNFLCVSRQRPELRALAEAGAAVATGN
jgi:FkbM family methyltransferase